MLACSQLEFSYGAKKRLHNVSFTLERQEFLGLFGHNGSGKSTLLKMLSGTLPICGSLKLFDEDAKGPDSYLKRQFRASIGVLFQGSSSDDKISARDNLYYAALLMGVKKQEAITLVERALFHAQLLDRALEPLKKFSGGMKRRLEIYRTFIHSPMLLLLDEPTAGLDTAESARFFSFLKTYQQETKASVIMATHRPEELLHCNRVLMLAQGKVIADSAPHALLSHLDYARCSFALSDDFTLPNAFLFDVRRLNDEAIWKARVKTTQISELLGHPMLIDGSVKEFSLECPSLSDAYDDLCRSEVV